MSTTVAAAPRSPSAMSGHVHGLVRLWRPPRHALHRRRPTASRDPRRRCHLQRRALHWQLRCPSTGAPTNYAIIISCNPDSGASARASRDYAIIISCNPDNDVGAGSASHRRKAATNDDKVDNARHPPVPLLLSTGDPHHLIYVG
jgi:hypothetical protein